MESADSPWGDMVRTATSLHTCSSCSWDSSTSTLPAVGEATSMICWECCELQGGSPLLWSLPAWFPGPSRWELSLHSGLIECTRPQVAEGGPVGARTGRGAFFPIEVDGMSQVAIAGHPGDLSRRSCQSMDP